MKLLHEREWVKDLISRDSFTADEAGEAAGNYGPDVITRLRGCRYLVVDVVGSAPNASHYRKRLYRVRLRTTLPAPPEKG